MRAFNIKTPDKKIVPALQDKIDNLTKPKGSLGRLEELAVQIGTIQQSLSPVLRTPQNIVFAADHGVVVEGVSFSAPEVTAQQIYNFLKGGGGINMFARQHHFILKVVDCGVNADFGDLPGLIHRKIRKSTDNYLYGPAMTPEEMERAIEIGAEMVSQPVQHPGSAEDKAVLQAGGGVLAQHGGGRRRGEVDLRQLGGVLHQCSQRKLRPRQDDAAYKFLFPVDGHQGDGCVGRNDHQRPRALGQCGHRAAEQFGTQLGGIVQPEADAALESRPDGQDTHRAEHLQSGQYPPRQRRHHTAQNAALDLFWRSAVERKQIQQPQAVFIDGGGGVGVEPSAEFQVVVLVAANGDVGVAEIDGKYHGWCLPACL